MAYRFGRNHWQDSDRLNLVLVCQQHQQWDQRLAAMREIYPPTKFPATYFTENSCREELERLMSLPTPNLRLDVSKHFVFSRKIMMEKWAEHLAAEVRKQQSALAENALIGLRGNGKLLKEALDPKTSSKRLEEIVKALTPLADRHKNDNNFKRTVGSLDAAITERMKTGEALDLDSLVLPPTNPVGEEVPSGTKGFLTPTHPMITVDAFFSPMLSLADAVREAAPVPVPEVPAFVEPVVLANPNEIPIPDDFLEPFTPSPKKDESVKGRTQGGAEEVMEEQEKEEIGVEQEIETKEEKEAGDGEEFESPASPVMKSAQKSGGKKKTEEIPLEVKLEEAAIKSEEGEDTPVHSETEPPLTPTPRGRGRPRIHALSSSSTKKDKDTPVSPPATPVAAAATPVTASTSEQTNTPVPVAARSSRRNKDSSQEPAPAATTSSSKKPRNMSVANSAARRRKEGTEEPASSLKGSSVPPTLRSESSFDGTTAPGSPGVATYREMEVQTDITIRQIVHETPMGERRRTNVQPVAMRKGRKSQLPADSARSASRTSSASTPAPRAGSSGPLTTRSTACQTSQRFDLEKDDVVLVRVDARPNYMCRLNELGIVKKVVVNEETCREIDAENAALGESSVEIGKRAVKVDGKREMTFIVESDDSIAQRLIEEKGYQLMSSSCDMPSTNDSPVKRSRTREDANNIKYQLLAMHRAILECEWAEQFRKPVPLCEEGYDETIKHKIDLSQIKKDIENGVITTVNGFLLRAYRMLANAIMFNSHDHEVSLQAKAIFDNVMGDITSMIDDRSDSSLQRRVRAKDANKDISRSGSMEPEPMTPLGEVGIKRAVFRKAPTNDEPMTTLGNRKSKKSMK